MKIIIKILFFVIVFFPKGNSQNISFYMNRQDINSIPKGLNWYELTYQGLSTCVPKIEYVKDEENDYEGNILVTNSNNILLIATDEILDTTKVYNFPFQSRELEFDKKFELSNEEFLVARKVKLDNESDELYSLFVENDESKKAIEIFRNCRFLESIDKYFGCGRIPFRIAFYGDITNDKIPEILLTADKEGGVLVLLIGKKEKEYEIIYSYQFE